jgi:ribosomal protein S12 methylthiotransferase accessory factor
MIQEIIITSGGNKKVNAQVGDFVVPTDQPAPSGDGTAPEPFSLFLSSIGTCAGIFVFSFCQKRGLSTDGIKIVEKIEARPEEEGYGAAKITLEICLPDDFPDKYRSALIKSANLCAVKRQFENPPVFDVLTSKSGE